MLDIRFIRENADKVAEQAKQKGYEVDVSQLLGFDDKLDDGDDYPDFVIPLGKAIANHEIDRGIAICGSGVGASIAANKIPGVKAALIHENFSAHQGVEDDNLNLLCLGGRVTGNEIAKELVTTFLNATFTGAARHKRRLEKVEALEKR